MVISDTGQQDQEMEPKTGYLGSKGCMVILSQNLTVGICNKHSQHLAVYLIQVYQAMQL
jgi:hypothetical protein